PSTRRVPEVAARRPAIRRMSVVLPAPSGPTSAVSSPARTSMETPSSARTSPPLPGARKVLRRSVPVTTADVMSGPRAVGRQIYRGWHTEPQLIAGILHEHADLVYETGAQLLRLHGLRREFGRG